MCLLIQNCDKSILHIISHELLCELKWVITDVPWWWSVREFVENLKIVILIPGISKKIPRFREILWKSSIYRFLRTRFSVNGDYFPVITSWLTKNIEKIIAASAAMIFSMFLKFTPFTLNRNIDLSQSRRSKKHNISLIYRDFLLNFMGKRVWSHVNSYRITVDSKYYQVTTYWSWVFVSNRKIGLSQFCNALQTCFWALWYGSDHLKHGIEHFSDGKLNAVASGMIYSCLSHHAVLDRLLGLLIQPPVIYC